MSKVFDFHPEHRDPVAFLSEQYARDLLHIVDGEDVIMSVIFMPDEHLRPAIVSDILSATIWEIQTDVKLCFNQAELLRFVPQEQHERIVAQMQNDEIVGLIEINDGEIRIKNDHQVLQAAMDYIGNWYTGFTMPTEEGIITINRDAFKSAIEGHGTVEAMAASMAQEIVMDRQATAPLNQTKH